jgi:hypothetical protein
MDDPRAGGRIPIRVWLGIRRRGWFGSGIKGASVDAIQRFAMVFDHVDVRVVEVAAARPFYDAFLKAFGFRSQRQASGDVVYYRFAEGAFRKRWR